MNIFLETLIYLLAVFGIVGATYFCFMQSYLQKLDITDEKYLKSVSNINNSKKKIELYLYNIDKVEESKILEEFKINDIENVNINIYKVIDKN